MKYFNIETLAKKTGLTRRTIRYYVQRGLLQKPEGGGRGHYYTDYHLERIKEIKRLTAQGVPLEKMKEFFSGIQIAIKEPSTNLVQMHHAPVVREDHWKRIRIGPDMEVSFRAGAISKEEEQAIKNFIISIVGKETES